MPDRPGNLPLVVATPLSWVYGVGMSLHRAWRRAGAERLGVPVISVGNLSVGGTGKTPMVLHLARVLAADGLRACVAMRGYVPRGTGGRGPGGGPGGTATARRGQAEQPAAPSRLEGSDEAASYRRAFAQLGLDVTVVAQPDRAAGVRALLTGGGRIDAVLLDDGFQHHRLARDLDIVLIDATRSPFEDRLLPAGWLREPVGALRRASAVVVTHAESVSAEELERLEGAIERAWGKAATAVASHRWEALEVDQGALAAQGGGQRHAEARTLPVEWLVGKRVLAVCAIGNPAAFLQAAARAIGAAPAASIVLRDHDPYAEAAVRRIVEASRGMDAVLTTDKDFSKLEGRLGGVECPVLRPRLVMRFERGGEELEATARRVAARRDGETRHNG